MRNNSEARRQMFEAIELWKQSGLSQRAFCEQQSLKFHTFYYWYKRYKQENNNNSQSAFLKLQIAKPVAASSVEIHFPDGIRLIFHEPVSSAYIKSIIS
ncbi:MAG: IS66 family insertion sequence element accessory protein TnpA [Nocardioidaceae bacterium]